MLRNYVVASYLVARIGDKIGVTSENKTIHTPSLSPPFNVEVSVVFLQAARTATQHCMDGTGEGKYYFPLLKSIKRQNGPLGAKCLNQFCR